MKIMWIMWIELLRLRGLCGLNYEDYMDYVDSMWIMWKKSRWKVDWIMKVQKHTVHTRLSHLLWFNKTLLAMWKKCIKHLLLLQNKRQIETQPPKPTFRILSRISSLQTDCAQTNYGIMFSHAIKTSVPVCKRQRLELKLTNNTKKKSITKILKLARNIAACLQKAETWREIDQQYKDIDNKDVEIGTEYQW